ESRASATLTATTVVICVIGATLPYTAIGGALGFAPLPPGFWPVVLVYAVAYGILAHLVKVWFVRRWGM
ncbi:hypothetical protein ABTC84_19250, partial [Acinetobacter baumannii]